MTDATPTIRKRVTLEADATLGGLFKALGTVPIEVPAEAEIVDATAFVDHEDDPTHEDGCIHTEKLLLEFEWDA